MMSLNKANSKFPSTETSEFSEDSARVHRQISSPVQMQKMFDGKFNISVKKTEIDDSISEPEGIPTKTSSGSNNLTHHMRSTCSTNMYNWYNINKMMLPEKVYETEFIFGGTDLSMPKIHKKSTQNSSPNYAKGHRKFNLCTPNLPTPKENDKYRASVMMSKQKYRKLNEHIVISEARGGFQNKDEVASATVPKTCKTPFHKSNKHKIMNYGSCKSIFTKQNLDTHQVKMPPVMLRRGKRRSMFKPNDLLNQNC